MTATRIRVGDILTLERRPISIDPTREYREIGVRSFGRGIIQYPATPGDQLSKLRYFELPVGALILSNIKAWEGAVAVSTQEQEGFIASNRFLSYVPIDDDAVDVRYVYYLLLSSIGAPLLERASPGAADRNRTLGIKAFEYLVIPIVGIDQQRQIAAHLHSIHQSRRTIARLAQRAHKLAVALRHSLYRIDSRVVRIGDILTLERRPVSIDPTREYREIGVRSFGRGLIQYPATPGDQLSKLRYFELPVGALILSNIKAWEGAVAVSTHEQEGFIASNRFLGYVPIDDDAVDVRYVYYLLLSSVGAPLLERASPGAADRNRTLGIKAFEDLRIPLPPIGVQRRIASLLDRAFGVLLRIDERERQLDAAVASALNRAFAGLA